MENAISESFPSSDRFSSLSSTLKTSISTRLGEGNVVHGASGDGTKCVAKLDPRSRAWLLSSAEADYDALVKLLDEDPDLYRLKDFHWGYTALHWAAKFGRTEIVDLIAGKYGLNPNVRSHGGYTPLHLAHMFEQREVAEQLCSYGADVNIRDHSGRKPTHYKKGGIPLPIREPVDGDATSTPKASASSSLHKDFGSRVIGSVRSKVKSTAAAVASPFSGHKVKPWSSADGISESDTSSMGPPKGAPKKAKSKIPFLNFGSLNSLRSKLSLKSSKSDSDSGSTYSASSY